MADKFERYLVEEENDPFQKYAVQEENKPRSVDTFLGKMPSSVPEFKLGSSQNKALIDELIGDLAGMPGLKVLGEALGKGARGIINTGKTALTKTAPYEEALEKAGQEFESATKAAEPVKPGLNRNPMSELETIENELGQHINAEGAHDVRAAKSITGRVKDIENYWSDAYKGFEEKVKDAQFHMPEQAMEKLSYDPDAIMQRIKAGANPKTVMKEMEKEAEAAKNPYYKHLISKAPTSKDTNAGEFLSKYRAFRDTLGDLKKDLKSGRYDSIEREKIANAIKDGKGIETQIKQSLNEGLGDFKPEFDRINKGYAEQVFPLRDNPIVKAAKKGKLSDNIIKDLRTNERGMPLVRELIKQDPELLRNVVGQRYMKNASEVHNPNELMREYLNEMPEFQKILTNKENILKKTAARKDIALKEKVRLEKELSAIKEAKSKAKGKLKAGGLAIGGLVGVPYGYGKLAKLFSSNE